METATKQTTFNSFVKMPEALSNENSCRLFLDDARWNGSHVYPPPPWFDRYRRYLNVDLRRYQVIGALRKGKQVCERASRNS